jgi:hypothetical protein
MAFSIPKSISREEAQRAIYLDFECNKDQPPSFAGTVIDGTYRATLLEEIFKPAATSKKLLLQDLSGFAVKILKHAQAEGVDGGGTCWEVVAGGRAAPCVAATSLGGFGSAGCPPIEDGH